MSQNDSNLPIIGGILAAVGASLCCAGPFVLLLLGISGSWIGNLTLFEPYKPIFIVAVLVTFGYAGWQLYRPIDECKPGTVCAVPQIRKRRQIIFWLASIVALALVTSSYWIILLA